MPEKVGIYARVSTKEQNIRQQVQIIRKYCNERGYKVYKSYEDVHTGVQSLKERKEFQRLLKHIDEGRIDGVVIYTVDRLTRDYYDGVEIERFFYERLEKCQLESVTGPIDLSTSDGRFQFRIQLVVACYQVEKTKERMKVGIERAKREGKYKGRKKKTKNKKDDEC